MKKNWLVVIGLVLVVVMIGLSGCYGGKGGLGELPSELRLNLGNQQEGIRVSGTGKVLVTPDIATLRLGIAAQEVIVAEAQSQAAEAMDKVMNTLTSNGVAKKDIQTQRFSIQQVTKWDRVKEEEIVVGYRVTNVVTAKIREIAKAGAVIDAVAVAGGDFTRIEGIGFSVDDPSAYYEEAREKAMADAKAKSEQLADLAGVRVGKPTYISESTYLPSPIPRQIMYGEAKVSAAPETPISAGEMEVVLTIQVAYTILD